MRSVVKLPEFLMLAGKKLSFSWAPLSKRGISSDIDLPGVLARSSALPSQPVVSAKGLRPPPCIRFCPSKCDLLV